MPLSRIVSKTHITWSKLILAILCMFNHFIVLYCVVVFYCSIVIHVLYHHYHLYYPRRRWRRCKCEVFAPSPLRSVEGTRVRPCWASTSSRRRYPRGPSCSLCLPVHKGNRALYQTRRCPKPLASRAGNDKGVLVFIVEINDEYRVVSRQFSELYLPDYISNAVQTSY